MSLNTYAGLIDGVKRWLNRPNMLEFVPDFISLAHLRMCREIRVDWCSQRTDLDGVTDSIAADGKEFDIRVKFPRFNGYRSLKVLGSPVKSLRWIAPESADNNNLTNFSGDSKYFTIDSQILTVLPGVPSGSTLRVVDYFKPAVLITTTVETNEFTENAFDAYLFASMLEASIYAKDDERAELWINRYSSAVNSIIEDDKQRRWGESSMEMSAPYMDSPFNNVSTG